jgi:hypothetical protein
METRQPTVYDAGMSIDLSPEQRDAVAHAGSTPIQVIDPQTQVTYVLLRADVYEQVRKVLDAEFDIREAYPLMDAAARAAGWDDAAEDLYDDLDPRRTS